MSKVVIDIHDSLVNYHFELNRRISILRGDSASGKTTFFELVADAVSMTRADVVMALDGIDSVETLSSTDARRLDSVISSFKNAVIIIDEVNFFYYTDLCSIIRKYCVSNNLYFLLISRDSDFHGIYMNFSFSINSVYKIIYKDGIHYLDSYYSFNTNSLYDYDAVIVEDRGKCYSFFNKYLKCKVFHAKSGKSSIVKDTLELIKNGYSNVLVLVDTAAFGCHMDKFVNLFCNLDKNVSIISYYECFEYLLIRSNLISSNSVILQEISNLEKYANSFLSWENYFEDLIARATKGKPYRYNHGSKRMSKCYMMNCDDCSEQLRSKCDVALFGDKFEEMIRGTEFEFLLNL